MFSAFKKGDWLKLKGITRHGKNRIHQHGEWWEVDAVGTFDGFPAVRLNSRNETFNIGKGRKCRDQRWFHMQNDKDFKLTFVLGREEIAHAVSH